MILSIHPSVCLSVHVCFVYMCVYVVCILCIYLGITLCIYAVFVYGVCTLCMVCMLLYPSAHLSIPSSFHPSIHPSLLYCTCMPVHACFVFILCIILCMYLQLFTKYLRKNLVFIWSSTLQEKLNLCFQEIFASTDKFFL